MLVEAVRQILAGRGSKEQALAVLDEIADRGNKLRTVINLAAHARR